MNNEDPKDAAQYFLGNNLGKILNSKHGCWACALLCSLRCSLRRLQQTNFWGYSSTSYKPSSKKCCSCRSHKRIKEATIQEEKVRYRVQENEVEFLINDQTYQAKIVSFDTSNIVFELNGIQLKFQLSINGNQICTHNEQAGNLTFQLKGLG